MKTDAEWDLETAEFRKKVEGKVVNLREANYYDDSDFYATYWDVEKQEFVEYMYDTTRCAGLMGVWAPRTADAPADLMVQYGAHRKALDEVSRIANKKFRSGETLKIVSGRKMVGEVKEFDRTWEYVVPGTYGKNRTTYAIFKDGTKVNINHCVPA